MSKKYTTNFLEDTNGSTGSANQVLVSTATGIDWVDGSGSGIIGGPYLPLSAGSGFPLTDTLYGTAAIFGNGTPQGATGSLLKLATASGNIRISLTSESTSIIDFGNQADFDNGGILYDNTAKALYFKTNATERMRINSSGNVGIGTTGPTEKLEVNGIIKNNSFINTGGQTGAMLLGRGNAISGSYLANDFLMFNTGGDSHILATGGAGMIIKATTGNVGIGTTSPGANLEVSDGTEARFRLTDSGGGANNKIFEITKDGPFTNFNVLLDTGVLRYTAVSIRTAGDTVFNTDGNANQLVIASTGNVGIGTTSPGAKLDVNGIIRGAGADYHTLSVADSGAQLRLERTGSSAGLMYVGADNIGFRVFDSSFNTRLIVTNTGNVGIGTTSPDAKLDVETSVADLIDMTRTGVGTYRFAISADDRFSIFDVGASSERISINSSGNVGIGTTSPGAKLDIEGNNGASANGQKVLELTDNIGWATIGSGPKIVFKRKDLDFDLAAIRSYVFGTNLTGLAFDTGHNALTTKMVIDNAGNVGIGTTSPDAKLEINDGSVQTELRLTVTGDSGYSTINFADASDINSGQIHYQHSANQMVFRTNDVNRMYINSTGNVGIGTTNPLATLDVNGSAVIAGTILSPSMPQHANNTSASNAGLPVGTLYYSISGTDGIVKIVI